MGCENQGYGTRGDAIEQICGYQREAIEQLGCMARTTQCGEATLKKDYFFNECRSNQRIVAPRCQAEQRALADCFIKRIDGAADRKAVFAETFECSTTGPNWYADAAEIAPNQYNNSLECPPRCHLVIGGEAAHLVKRGIRHRSRLLVMPISGVGN